MQSSGAGGSDGSADDEGSPSEVSHASLIPLFRIMPALDATDKQLSVVLIVDHKTSLRTAG